MKPEEHSRRQQELAGWPVIVETYKLGDVYHCTITNVDPGARFARGDGATKDEAPCRITAVGGFRRPWLVLGGRDRRFWLDHVARMAVLDVDQQCRLDIVQPDDDLTAFACLLRQR